MTKTILVVDDARFMRMRIRELLTEQGYKVVEAEDGEEAVEIYRSTKPDAVLMDITMPRKDGLTALKEIMADDAQARVIILTALGQQAMVLEAMKAGAKDFLVKPYDPDKVIKSLQKVLARVSFL
ncbi:MAG: response regulator [Anaerolineae bacterium]|nr:response regulator [Anaerolineae bacterium]